MANQIGDFHVRAVQRADGHGAVHHELHVARAAGFLGSGGELFADLAGRHQHFGGGNVVILEERNLNHLAGALMRSHLRGQHVDEVDDLLRAAVTRRGLRAEDKGARRHRVVRIIANAVVEHEDVQRVEQLALVLMQTLDLHVEHHRRIQLDALMAVNPAAEALLVFLLDCGKLFDKGCVVRKRQQLFQLIKVFAPALADGFIHQLGERRVGQHQPAARRDAVSDRVELLRHDGVVIRKRRVLEDIAVQLGNAVDRVGIRHAHVRHVRLIVSQNRHVADAVPLTGERVEELLAQAAVQLLHDGVNARQRLSHHVLRPLFQRLSHDGVVGIRHSRLGNALSLFPRQPLFIHKNAHQLRNDHRRVRVVDVESDLLRQLAHVRAVNALKVLDGVLQRRADEEIFLHQAELFAVVGVVFRIEHLRNLRRDGIAVLRGAIVIAGGELLQVEVLRQNGAPRAQAIHHVAVVAQNRQVIRHGDHVFGVLEGDVICAAHPVFHHLAAEADLHRVALGRNLPGVAVGQPLVRHLDLLAVHDALTEQAVFIADGAAHRRQIERRQRIEEARSQAAQTAVAQRRFRLLMKHAAQGQPQLLKRLLILLGGAEVEQVVVQPAAGQKLDGKVIQPLGLFAAAGFLFKAPLEHDLVSHGARHDGVNLLGRRILDGAAVIAQQLVEDGFLDGILVILGLQRHRFKPSQI